MTEIYCNAFDNRVCMEEPKKCTYFNQWVILHVNMQHKGVHAKNLDFSNLNRLSLRFIECHCKF